MKRIAFQFKVRADKLEEYKAHHKNVWPEMLDALRETGWHNYSLFLRGDGLMFGYFETPYSLPHVQALMEEKEVNIRWQQFMAPFFEGDGRLDKSFLELEEIFHLD